MSPPEFDRVWKRPLPRIPNVFLLAYDEECARKIKKIDNTDNIRNTGHSTKEQFTWRFWNTAASESTCDYLLLKLTSLCLHDPRESQTYMDSRAEGDWSLQGLRPFGLTLPRQLFYSLHHSFFRNLPLYSIGKNLLWPWVPSVVTNAWIFPLNWRGKRRTKSSTNISTEEVISTFPSFTAAFQYGWS